MDTLSKVIQSHQVRRGRPEVQKKLQGEKKYSPLSMCIKLLKSFIAKFFLHMDFHTKEMNNNALT